jgi:hypothetical protein
MNEENKVYYMTESQTIRFEALKLAIEKNKDLPPRCLPKTLELAQEFEKFITG